MASLSLILIVDTREQLPLSWSRYKDVEATYHYKLHVGDYAAIFKAVKRGVSYYHPCSLYFDRKGKGDLWGTMTSGYERFTREFNKSLELDLKLLLIAECDTTSIMKGYSYSKVKGSSMMKKLETLRARYGLETVYTGGRNDMKRYMFERWMGLAREWYKTV